MKFGKKICELLKTIRNSVASANGIDYTPEDCHYEGDCAGSCPKCDKELSDLQKQLDTKQLNGEEVIYDSSEDLGSDITGSDADSTKEFSILKGYVPVSGMWTDLDGMWNDLYNDEEDKEGKEDKEDKDY